ncbi:hypothetical protein D9M69_587040 [compost metagenome]
MRIYLAFQVHQFCLLFFLFESQNKFDLDNYPPDHPDSHSSEKQQAENNKFVLLSKSIIENHDQKGRHYEKVGHQPLKKSLIEKVL